MSADARKPRENQRIRLRVRDECESNGIHPALVVYCGLPELHPLAYYHDSHYHDVVTLPRYVNRNAS